MSKDIQEPCVPSDSQWPDPRAGKPGPLLGLVWSRQEMAPLAACKPCTLGDLSRAHRFSNGMGWNGPKPGLNGMMVAIKNDVTPSKLGAVLD